MTSEITGAPGTSLLARGRKMIQFLRTFDIDQVGALISDFDARMHELEQRQRRVETLLTEASARLDSVLMRPEDRNTALVSLLDIKNLGYQIGQWIGEKTFAGRVPMIDHSRLLSKLCTQDDFATDWLLFWCHEMRTAAYYHRKLWEFCYISQALFSEGMLAPGRRGLGFGCGEEPLPSLFAKYGASVLGTDLAADQAEAQAWRQTGQHAPAIEAIRRPDICPDPALLLNIGFQPVDMNVIPREFDGQFDFCWSSCALEHLGTLANGLSFIENSLRTLKPGGIAVHTTEFTLTEGPTIDNHPIVLYQRQHFEELAERVKAAGHEMFALDFNPGTGVLDCFVDLPPYRDNVLIAPNQFAHLKLLFDGYTCTSIGLIIRA